MMSLAEHTLNKAIDHHIENGIPFYENVFRPHSEMSNRLFVEARAMFTEGSYTPDDWFEQDLLASDIGDYDVYEGESIPLDFPLQEAEYNGRDVDLDSPMRGGRKKFYVYVRDPKTKNVKKVSFGDVNGLKVKLHDPGAVKSFVARHDCANKTDKTKAGYWSCRLPRFAKAIGLSSGGGDRNMFW